MKYDQPRVLNYSVTCPEVSEEADGELQRRCTKTENESVVWRGWSSARSCSCGHVRGKHSTEKMLGREPQEPAPESRIISPTSGSGDEPRGPQNHAQHGWNRYVSLPEHVMSSKWQGSGIIDKIATSVIKVFCYPNSFCFHTVICSSTTTTPEGNQNIFA